MGGRGSSTGKSEKKKPYGSEYQSLLTIGNIRFVIPTGGNTTAPLETMTSRRIYVTLDREGHSKYITYYDKENKRCKQIDLTKPHKGVLPHTHHGYNHNELDTKKGFANLTTKEIAMVHRVTEIWRDKKNAIWNEWTNTHH